jgi:Protein of unknown function (DUF2587)
VAHTTRPPGGPGGPGPADRVVIALGPGGLGKTCRVESPGRVLRLWALLNATGEELHVQDLPAASRAGVKRQLTAVTAELSRCVSADLAAELGNLWQPGDGVPGAAELRIDYALVLGWLGGLVIGMLEQLDPVATSKPEAAAHQAGGAAIAGVRQAGQPEQVLNGPGD